MLNLSIQPFSYNQETWILLKSKRNWNHIPDRYGFSTLFTRFEWRESGHNPHSFFIKLGINTLQYAYLAYTPFWSYTESDYNFSLDIIFLCNLRVLGMF